MRGLRPTVSWAQHVKSRVHPSLLLPYPSLIRKKYSLTALTERYFYSPNSRNWIRTRDFQHHSRVFLITRSMRISKQADIPIRRCCQLMHTSLFNSHGGGRVVRRCCVNFQCRCVLLIWIIVEQGPIALAVGACGGCLDIFSLIYHFSFLSPSLWETARYRLKYCLKGPLSPKTTNQPINSHAT